MSALRVGLFTECYRPIQNGIVASVDSLAHTLRTTGHSVVLVTPAVPHFRDTDRDVVRVPSLPLPTGTAYRLTMPYVPVSLGALSIVHTHSPFITGWLGLRAARRAGAPLVFTYHTQLEAYAHYVPFEARTTRSAATQLTRLYANAADAVIVPTQAMKARLGALGVRSHIEVVPSGIDLALFSCGTRKATVRARFQIGPGEKMILSVGRLGREKNVELALDAFARLQAPRAKFVIVGDGTHRAALERRARRMGIADSVVFAGEFLRETLPDVYASADAFLFTSSSETQGLVLAEALAAGVPVVAVDAPQTVDVLAGAATVAADDPGALAAALSDVLLGKRCDSAIGRSIAARYDHTAQAHRVIALYASLVGAVPVGRLAIVPS